MLGVARALDGDAFREHRDIEAALGEHGRRGRMQEFRKVSGSHRYILWCGEFAPAGRTYRRRGRDAPRARQPVSGLP
ncbi:hypothetical protein GCM10009551_061310 [Nocardiopsis tropica]